MTDEMLNKRLGEPIELATQAAEQSRRATWVGRHPLMVFALLPVPIAVAVMIAVEIVIGLTFEVMAVLSAGGSDHVSRSTIVTIAYGNMWAIRYVPFVLLAALFTRLYTRHHVNRWWFAAAAVQILALAGSLISQINYSETPGQSQHVLGLALMPLPMGAGWGLPYLSMVGWIQLSQILVPVAVGGFMLWATRRPRRGLGGVVKTRLKTNAAWPRDRGRAARLSGIASWDAVPVPV